MDGTLQEELRRWGNTMGSSTTMDTRMGDLAESFTTMGGLRKRVNLRQTNGKNVDKICMLR